MKSAVLPTYPFLSTNYRWRLPGLEPTLTDMGYLWKWCHEAEDVIPVNFGALLVHCNLQMRSLGANHSNLNH